MKRVAKLMARVALIQMILSALRNTLEAQRSNMQESRRVRIAENRARRNWQAWQQTLAEAEHLQQAAERAEQQRKLWQEARDEALAFQQAREMAAQQRYAALAGNDGARATAEWLQKTVADTEDSSRSWLKAVTGLALAHRLGAAAVGARHEIAAARKSVSSSKTIKAARRGLIQTWAQHGWGKARARRIARQRRTQRLNAVAIGAGVGAIAWYFLDPETGSQRRAQFRARVMSFVRSGQAGLGSSLGDRYASQPASDLSSPVAASGQGQGAGAFAGAYAGGASSGSLASGLTGGAAVPAAGETSWPIGVRVLAGLAGGVLMVTGLGFRGAPGIGGRAVGAGLLARALTNMPFSRLARRGDSRYENLYGTAGHPGARDSGEIEIGRDAPVSSASVTDVSPSIDIFNPGHSDVPTGNLGTFESQISPSQAGDALSAGKAAETESALGASSGASAGGPLPGSGEAAMAAAEAAVNQIETAADPDAAARGIDFDETSGERRIPFGQWQAFFDEIGRDYGARAVVVERADGTQVAEQPLLGASVNLRPDGRDVRLLLGANLGTHMDHVIEDVRSLVALPGRAGARGFRLEAADGATTVRPASE